MPVLAQYAPTITGGLRKSAFFSTFPANLLLIPLEILADYNFLCPCDSTKNTYLIVLLFSAPVIFLSAVMLLLYWHAKYIKKDKQKASINFLIGVFPPIFWIMLLLFDGEYVACSKTEWKGEYVLDDELKIKWCKPTESIPGRNETELQNQILSYITGSQCGGLILLICFSVVAILVIICTFCCYAEELEECSPEDNDL